MTNKLKVRVLQHMARTGGTLISKCLAVMPGVILLSEIHPRGAQWLDPREQAHKWFGLLSQEEAATAELTSDDEFLALIQQIEGRCRERGRQLVIRDWSHLDFTGVPFVSQPSYRSATLNVLRSQFDILQVATVRHPLDQLLSLKGLAPMQPGWNEAAILRGMKHFAEHAAAADFFRYEDFVVAPDDVLHKMCQRLELDFDIGYRNRWADYVNITGDKSDDRPEIAMIVRGPVDPATLDRLYANDDYRAILELLGYEHPQPPVEYLLAPPGEPGRFLDKGEIDQLFAGANELCNAKGYEEAVREYQQVLLRRPTHAAALNNMGFCLWQLQRHDWSALELHRALACQPDFTLALVNLIGVLEDSGRRFEAIPYRRRLTELDPEVADHCFHLANTLISAGRIEEALFYSRRALRVQPRHLGTASNYLLYLHYSNEETPESIAREHFRLAPLWAKPLNAVEDATARQRTSGNPRIGYVSSDFFTHPVGKVIQPLIAAHDKSSFEVYCYHDGKHNDNWTALTEEVSTVFRRTRGMTSAEVWHLIRQDEVDVLVDLAGYTNGGNRLDVFASLAAPVQIGFLGYPDTTGLPGMHYRITDRFCDPPGQTERWYSEQLLRLRRGFLCYAPPDRLPPADMAPFRQHGDVTFGSFNNIAKISEAAYRTWARIMHRVPDSRLIFKYGDRYESMAIRERVHSFFASYGIEPRRVQFLPSMPTMEEHLKVMGSVDIALDSFPYQGTITTLELLSMSVPIITLCGQTYSSRASSALLMRLGLHELVADDEDEYIEIAAGLADNRDLLVELRTALREQFFSSEICDVQGYVGELEDTYRQLASI